ERRSVFPPPPSVSLTRQNHEGSLSWTGLAPPPGARVQSSPGRLSPHTERKPASPPPTEPFARGAGSRDRCCPLPPPGNAQRKDSTYPWTPYRAGRDHDPPNRRHRFELD